MITIVVAAFYLAGILCAIHAAMTVRTAQGAVAWSVSLVSFPFIAVPAYLVLGRNKFDGMSDAFHERLDDIDDLLANFSSNLEPWAVRETEAPSWHRVARHLSNFELTRGNSLSSVGTHNFDDRSFRLNFEVTALIVDKSFASEMEAMFEHDFQHYEPIDPAAFEEKPIWWRAAVQLSRLTAPVL